MDVMALNFICVEKGKILVQRDEGKQDFTVSCGTG